MKNKKRFLIGMLAALCVTGGVIGCNNNQSQPDPEYGEDGVYYFDVNGEDHLLTLNNNSFTLVQGSDVLVGTYTYDGENLALQFEGQSGQTQATLEDGVIVFTYGDINYELLKKINYTVTYDIDGKTTTATVVNGKLLEKPADPSKEGYNFVGWYKDSGYTQPFLFEAMPITEDITLYARFEAKTAGQSEYDVTLVVDGSETVYEARKTLSGKVFDLPTPTKEGATFVGWWMSDYQSADKLTCEYKDQTLTEDTKLFAVWASDSLNASVNSTGIVWHEKGVVNSYVVKVKDANGNVLNGNGNGNSVSQANFEWDFSKLAAGDYTVDIEANGVITTVYYQNKALDRVSVFSVAEPSVLIFNGVPNAEKYYITVECGNESHTHTEVDNGTINYYNFANCTMQEGGIKFTVTAIAEGYASSVSETFAYSRDLASVTGLKVDSATEVVAWNKVDNATAYVLEITNNGKTETVNVGPTNTYSIKGYTGEISIKVTPVANGYNSSDAVEVNYTKATLAAPKGVVLTGKTLTWDNVEGATKYIVKVGAKEIEVSGNSLTLTDEHYDTALDQYKVSVKAIGATENVNSQYSDSITVRFASMSKLSYANGKVSWEGVISADRYAVKVNEGTEVSVTGDKNTFEPIFTKAGVNTIRVCYYDADNVQSTWVSIEVYAYRIMFEEGDGERVAPIYKASGDKLILPTTTAEGYNFDGWYTAEGGASGVGVKYDATSYQESGNLTLYAGWTAKKYQASFNVAGGTAIDTTVDVTYKEKFTLPVPKHEDAAYVFDGWYSEANGGGIRYTYENGESLAGWQATDNVTLVANWIQPIRYVLLNDDTYSVSQGVHIGKVTEITIPAMYNGKRVTRIDSFAGCANLVSVNIPDSIQQIAWGSGAYETGSAFQNCTALQRMDVYCACNELGKNHNVAVTDKFVRYSSQDGVLIYDNANTGVEIKYVPMAISGKFEIPYGVEVIPTNAFKGSPLTEIVIPSTVKIIHDSAFENSKLTSVTFKATENGETVVPLELGEKVFRYCTGLKSVTFPSRLSHFSSSIFDKCWYLTEVNINGEDGKYISREGSLCEGSKLVYVPVGAGRGDANGKYTIPTGVTTIGSKAFSKCEYITDVVIPHFVTLIESQAFKYEADTTYSNYNDTLRTVTFEGDENSAPINIKSEAFYSCFELTKIVLPAKTGTVESHAVGATQKLTEVEVNGGANMVLQESAFGSLNDDFYLTKVTLGANVGEIDIAAVFGGDILAKVIVHKDNKNYTSTEDGVLFNKAMTTIVYYPTTKIGKYEIPESVTTIGAQVFRNKTSLTEIKIGYKVTSIGTDAFRNCTNLTKIEFEPTPAGTEAVSLEIAAGAFSSTKISSIELPERLTKLTGDVFSSCGSLTSVTIPASVTEMGVMSNGKVTDMNTFGYCSNLQTINVAENNTKFASIDGVLYGLTDGVITDLYLCPRKNTGDKNGVVDIPKTVTKIWASAFASNAGVKEVKFSQGIEGSIQFGDSAFSNTTTLKKVTLPSGLETLPALLFNNCKALQTIVVPNTVTQIKARAIANCPELTLIDFEKGGTDALTFANGDSYGGAIYNCSNLQTLDIPQRTTTLGAKALSSNTSLKKVTIPASVTSIGESAFTGCTALEEVVFATGNALQGVSNYMFKGCSSLTKITLPASVQAIGTGAFYDCKALETIAIPDAVALINASAFENARSLKAVVLSANSNLEEIGTKAFYNAVSLVSSAAVEEGTEAKFVVPATVYSIGESAFEKCTALTTLTFAANTQIEELGKQAFAYSGLTAFEFPESDVLEIGDKIFLGCKTLTHIHLSSSIAAIDTILNGCHSVSKLTVAPGNTNFSIYEDPTMPNVTFVMNGDATGYRYIFGDLKGKFTIKDTVTSIGASAFAYQDLVTEIVVSKSVQTIADSAFKGCTELTKVTFETGSALTSIGKNAFDGCEKLAEVNGLPNSLVSVGNYAFRNCYALSTINLPDAVDSLGTYVFQNAGLTSIAIPASIESIPNYAFDGCTKLAKVTLHQYVKSIGTAAFQNTKALKSIDLSKTDPNGLTLAAGSSSHGVFRNSGLESIVIPAQLTAIPTYVFRGCENLTSVTFHKGITSIGNYSFAETGLTSVELPLLDDPTLLTLGTYIFNNCKSLSSVTIPDGFVKLSSNMFYGCSALTKIELPDSLTGLSDSFKYTGLKEVVIPSKIEQVNGTFTGCAELSKVTFLCTNLTTLGNYAFQYCEKLETIQIPSTVTTFGNSVFQGTSIKNIDVSSVTTFGQYVFSCTPKLESVKFNDDVTTLPNYLFAGSAIKKVTLPASLTKIPGYIFAGYTLSTTKVFYPCLIEELVIPENVTSITTYAFGTYTISSGVMTADTTPKNLKSVKVEARLTSLPNYLFRGCEALEEVDLSATAITKLPSYTFQDCMSLTTIKLPDSINSYDTYVFQNCKSLTNVPIPDALTTIPNYAFYGCESLTSIDWPSNITSIGQYAFFGTKSLKSVQIPDTVTTINTFAFANSGLTSVNIGKGVTSIGTAAFGCPDLTEITVNSQNTKYTSDSAGILYQGNNIMMYPTAGLIDENGTLTLASIPDGKTLGTGALYSNKVKKVVLPATLKSIGNYMFDGLTDLEEVVIPEGVTSIGSYAFRNCTSLRKVNIPDSVTSIGSYAFPNCTNLETVAMTENSQMRTVSSYAFSKCAKLTDFVFGSSISSLGGSAFNGCSSLVVDVVLTDNLSSFGSNVFAYSGIKSIEFPVTFTDFSDGYVDERYPCGYADSNAFQNCVNLERAIMPGVTLLPGYTFYGCTSLKEIVLPETQDVVIGSYAFANCGFETLTVKKNWKMSNGAFNGCASLKTLIFEDGFVRLEEYVYDPDWVDQYDPGYLFANCTALETIILPDTLEYVEYASFSGCTAVKNIVIPGNTTIGSSVFSGWTADQTIYVVAKAAEANTLWNSSWKNGCSAKIVYRYEAPTDGE